MVRGAYGLLGALGPGHLLIDMSTVDPIATRHLADVVQETGAGYVENARLKAEAFGRASGLAALADDSGLEVDALGGEPGALHHLQGWDGRDQAERIQILLDALKDVPLEKRTACFRTVVVVVLPDGRSFVEEGACEGVIALAPVGSNGFGYDPVFFYPPLGKRLAELSTVEKNQVSHRSIATAKMKDSLQELAAHST